MYVLINYNAIISKRRRIVISLAVALIFSSRSVQCAHLYQAVFYGSQKTQQVLDQLVPEEKGQKVFQFFISAHATLDCAKFEL